MPKLSLPQEALKGIYDNAQKASQTLAESIMKLMNNLSSSLQESGNNVKSLGDNMYGPLIKNAKTRYPNVASEVPRKAVPGAAIPAPTTTTTEQPTGPGTRSGRTT